MYFDIRDIEECFSADGPGAFGEVEFFGPVELVLRSSGLKTADVSGTVRLQFDGKRNENMTGRRFEPMGIWLMNRGSVYKIRTTLHLHDVPAYLRPKVMLTDDAKDTMQLLHDTPSIDEDGTVSFIVMPFRKMEMDTFTSLATLVFDEDSFTIDEITEGIIEDIEARVISKIQAKKKPPVKKPAKKKVVKGEDNPSNKHPDNTKT